MSNQTPPTIYERRRRGRRPTDGTVATTQADRRQTGRITASRRSERSGPTRRRLLGTLGALAGASIAGCLGGDGNGDGGGGSDGNGDGGDGSDGGPDPAAELDLAGGTGAAFRDWVIPDNPIQEPVGAQVVCRYEDLAAAEEAGFGPLINHRNNTADALGVEPADVSGELAVGAPEDWPLSEIGIIFGDFDKEAIVDYFQDPGDRTITGEYGEYTIFDTIAAIGPTAVLETTRYRDYIDASVGDHARIGETNDAFGLLFDVLPDGVVTRVFRRHDKGDVAVSARTSIAFTDDDSVRRAIDTIVFESADAASTERATELVSVLPGFDGVVTEESSGRVAMVEYDVN